MNEGVGNICLSINRKLCVISDNYSTNIFEYYSQITCKIYCFIWHSVTTVIKLYYLWLLHRIYSFLGGDIRGSLSAGKPYFLSGILLRILAFYESGPDIQKIWQKWKEKKSLFFSSNYQHSRIFRPTTWPNHGSLIRYLALYRIYKKNQSLAKIIYYIDIHLGM